MFNVPSHHTEISSHYTMYFEVCNTFVVVIFIDRRDRFLIAATRVRACFRASGHCIFTELFGPTWTRVWRMSRRGTYMRVMYSGLVVMDRC